MFRPAAQTMTASAARYRSIEVNGRVDGASPHKLIAILFDELVKAIETTRVAVLNKDIGRQADRQARALSILQALDASLDHEKGGEIATALSSIYREGRRLISTGVRESRPELVEQARAMIAEIASAWEVIGSQPG